MDIPSREPLFSLSIGQEAELVRRAQAGDRDAFADLYRAYVQAVYRYMLLRLSNTQQAEDLTAEVFLRAVDGLPRYSNRGLPFGAWLFRIARDRLVDYYRQSARRPIFALEDSLPDELPDPGAAAEARAATQALSEALGQLTDEQRDVIQFRYMENWSLEETAQALNKSVNAVKALQHRALGALYRLLKGHE